ncbi:hypothetical protein D9619_002014 [Psilocybe cf. subviscida]|uniref:Uncharacterized protein n=1 Tax=Psilocybe cf. subviscida TaxID=2480587 RepID=A0A8H5BIG3_9AGAR|nr:hypothetical protein D9619_002014 [Psilocybe cf. subviscida]
MTPLAVPKYYTDRAVQTDLTITSPFVPGFTIDISDTSTCFLPALKTVSPSETESPQDAPMKSGAYMQSEHSPLEDSIEILPSRKDRKVVSLTSGLGYPSTLVTTTKQRVVSLPEHSSSGPARLALVERQTRVVSMPERGKLSSLVSVSKNAGASASANFGAGSTGRSYPSDVPQTPSPPSSPDSVMIMGNGEQVSGSFLQGRRRSFTDEDGWVTWASSPPRPIPALHGPLSLPYARCPSGAEGTVVEGDDLSHKIWGLGADDAPAHTRYHRTLPHTASQPTLANHSPEIKAHTFGDQYQASSHQRRRDTVIDLSQPSTFDHIQDAHQSSRNSANAAAQGSTAKDLPDLVASAMAKLTVLPHVRQQDHRDAPKKTYGAETAAGDQLGFALQWESLFNSDPQAKAWMNGSKSLGTGQGSSNNRLNTSAPPFVPQNYVSQSLLDRAILQDKPRHSRIEQTQRPGYRSSDTLATIHTLQDHNAQSPPSTASPLWTPIFAQATDMHHAHGKSFESRAGQHMPDVYSPELERGAYQSNQLGGMHMISQLQSYDLQGLSHGGLNKEEYSPQASLGNSHSSQDLNQLRGRQPVIEIHQQQPPMLFDTSNDNHGGSNATVTTMDRRRSLTQQHPRSIPLARLIQRRLSSVVEEEVLTGGNCGDNTSSSSSFPRQLPSGAPVRRLPISPETLRAVHSSSMFAQRSRPKMSNNNAYADDREFERQPVLGLGGVGPENPSLMVSMMGTGGGGGGKLQQLNVKDGPKAVVKLPQSGPRTDARGIVLNSNRHTAGHVAVTREYAHAKHSREDTMKQEEKENAKANSESATATAVAGKTSSKKNHNNRHKKRSERASAASSKAT